MSNSRNPIISRHDSLSPMGVQKPSKNLGTAGPCFSAGENTLYSSKKDVKEIGEI